MTPKQAVIECYDLFSGLMHLYNLDLFKCQEIKKRSASCSQLFPTGCLHYTGFYVEHNNQKQIKFMFTQGIFCMKNIVQGFNRRREVTMIAFLLAIESYEPFQHPVNY